MAADMTQPGSSRDPATFAEQQKEHSSTEAVVGAYSAALRQSPNERCAFDAAVQTFLLYNPNVPEPTARRAVARIISWKD